MEVQSSIFMNHYSDDNHYLRQKQASKFSVISGTHHWKDYGVNGQQLMEF